MVSGGYIRIPGYGSMVRAHGFSQPSFRVPCDSSPETEDTPTQTSGRIQEVGQN